MELSSKVLDAFLHDGIYLLVIQCLLIVLKNKVHSVGFLALGELFSLIDVKESDTPEEFLLCLIGYLLNLLELDALIQQECEVATNGRELADFCIGNSLILDSLHELLPTYVSIVNGGRDTEALQYPMAYDTHLNENFSSTVLHLYALVIDVRTALGKDEHAEGYAQASENVHDVCLELIE